MMKLKSRQKNSLIELFEVRIYRLKLSNKIRFFFLECQNYLKELDLKLAWPATKVLQAIARANPTCASMIWSNIIPLLIKQFENLEQVTFHI